MRHYKRPKCTVFIHTLFLSRLCFFRAFALLLLLQGVQITAVTMKNIEEETPGGM